MTKYAVKEFKTLLISGLKYLEDYNFRLEIFVYLIT